MAASSKTRAASATAYDDSVSCPVCGKSLGHLNQARRQVHTNQCLEALQGASERRPAKKRKKPKVKVGPKTRGGTGLRAAKKKKKKKIKAGVAAPTHTFVCPICDKAVAYKPTDDGGPVRTKALPKWYKHIRACAASAGTAPRDVIQHFRDIEEVHGLAYAAPDAADAVVGRKGSAAIELSTSEWVQVSSFVTDLLGATGNGGGADQPDFADSNADGTDNAPNSAGNAARPRSTIQDFFTQRPLVDLQRQHVAMERALTYVV